MAADKGQSDSEFLSAQQAAAREKMSRARGELLRHLKEGLNPLTWTRAHPIAAVSVAAAAGFVAAPGTGNGKHEEAESVHARPADGARQSAGPSLKQELLGKLARELIKAIHPVVSGIITAYVAAHQPEAAPPDEAGFRKS